MPGSLTKRFVKSLVRSAVEALPARYKNYLRYLLDPTSENAEKVDLILRKVTAATQNRDFSGAFELLRSALLIDPCDLRIPPHLSRVRFLEARARDPATQAEIEAMRTNLQAMDAELTRNPDYTPNEFWGTIGAFHRQVLEEYGMGNFKRTVSHQYQNWYMTTTSDPQVRHLFEMWPTHLKSEPWLNIMEVPDNVGIHSMMDFSNAEYPLAGTGQREIYRIAVGLLWEFVLDSDEFRILEKLDENAIGNPIRIWRHNRLISSDLAHSVRERNLFLRALNLEGNEGLTVAELGGGHGRLAEIFGHTTNYRHFIFDITPALYVSQWYVKNLFPNEKIFEFRAFGSFEEIQEELKGCRFAFFTANQIELFPDDACDLFINMNSLMEMRMEQIRSYLKHIERLATKGFMSRQWLTWLNPVDGNTVTRDDFLLDASWRLVLDQIDEIYPEFFNHVWQKTSVGLTGGIP